MRFISVDLPDPDGPMMATYSPRSISTDQPRSAWISSSPITYVFQRSRVSISAIGRGLQASGFEVRGSRLVYGRASTQVPSYPGACSPQPATRPNAPPDTAP